MQIRNMRIEDYDEMYASWMKSAGIRLTELDDSREGICNFLSRNPDSCFVATQNKAIIATILGGTDGRRGYIYHMWVDEKFRNQGIATKLVDVTLSALKHIGIVKVSLVVFKNNSAANTFWEKRGFIEREDLIYRNRPL
ncbi:MAG: GNAT family N-acetyltransferase [Desulfovibrio sp.]|nr:GNAT family N-acetyltransferase [Desulfovibrio sp.]